MIICASAIFCERKYYVTHLGTDDTDNCRSACCSFIKRCSLLNRWSQSSPSTHGDVTGLLRLKDDDVIGVLRFKEIRLCYKYLMFSTIYHDLPLFTTVYYYVPDNICYYLPLYTTICNNLTLHICYYKD